MSEDDDIAIEGLEDYPVEELETDSEDHFESDDMIMMKLRYFSSESYIVLQECFF